MDFNQLDMKACIRKQNEQPGNIKSTRSHLEFKLFIKNLLGRDKQTIRSAVFRSAAAEGMSIKLTTVDNGALQTEEHAAPALRPFFHALVNLSS